MDMKELATISDEALVTLFEVSLGNDHSASRRHLGGRSADTEAIERELKNRLMLRDEQYLDSALQGLVVRYRTFATHPNQQGVMLRVSRPAEGQAAHERFKLLHFLQTCRLIREHQRSITTSSSSSATASVPPPV